MLFSCQFLFGWSNGAWAIELLKCPRHSTPKCIWVLRLRFKRSDGVRSGGGPAFIPNPSQTAGDHHPGHIPHRLWMLMQLMLHAMSLEQLHIGHPNIDWCFTSKAFQFHGEFENVDMFAGRRAISKAYVRKNKSYSFGHLAWWQRRFLIQILLLQRTPKSSYMTFLEHTEQITYFLFWILACQPDPIFHRPMGGNIARRPAKDILQPLGFLRSLWAVMNLCAGGLFTAGIKCSTWSIVNRP